jgi:hypothetical protein
MDGALKASMDNLQYAEHVMPLWIDGAKTFAATASAALGLTIIFKEKVIGNSGRMKTSAYLIGSWLSYLLCIGTSILYQWMAARWIIALPDAPHTDARPEYYPFPHLGLHVIYGVMMACFFIGSILLVNASVQEMREAPIRELKEIEAAGVRLPWSLIRAKLRSESMALPIILSAISAISSALKIAEFVEQHGLMPTGQDLISLNLELAQEQPILAAAAIAINGTVGDAENRVFEGTQKRVADCLYSMDRALEDKDVLPDQRRRFGVAGRKCVCGEVGVIRDLLGGSLPPELAQIWDKYNCGEVYKLKSLNA